jgi:hypothetical protein
MLPVSKQARLECRQTRRSVGEPNAAGQLVDRRSFQQIGAVAPEADQPRSSATSEHDVESLRRDYNTGDAYVTVETIAKVAKKRVNIVNFPVPFPAAGRIAKRSSPCLIVILREGVELPAAAE